MSSTRVFISTQYFDGSNPHDLFEVADLSSTTLPRGPLGATVVVVVASTVRCAHHHDGARQLPGGLFLLRQDLSCEHSK